MINKEDKLKMFANEIGDISDPKLKDFAREIVSNAEDYFFSVPASSSGKYHPTFSLGEGGLVRHTRCVEYFARCMAESLNFSTHDTDLIIIAAIAHDIAKQGKGSGTGHTVKEHPICGADYVIEIYEGNKTLISAEDVNKIASAVRSHMGKWGVADGLPAPETEFEKALQAADYIASRKDILEFNFRDVENVEIHSEEFVPEQTDDSDPGKYVIGFGKHKGETLEEAYSSGYLNWMVGVQDFFNKEAQDMARKYLSIREGKGKKKVVESNNDGFDVINSIENKLEKKSEQYSSEVTDDLPF